MEVFVVLCPFRIIAPKLNGRGIAVHPKAHNTSQPERVFLDELEALAKLLNKNLEKQKGLYEVFFSR